MQRFISKYATAAHLAVMAVAPFALLPLVGAAWAATVTLWLALFGIMWMMLEPSIRAGEMPHDARRRLWRGMRRDPLFWFSLLLVLLTGVRALNTGIALAYDAELQVWSVTPPFFTLLPGCVAGAGYLAFAVAVDLMIIFQATRFALGRMARAVFLVVLSIVSAMAALTLLILISYGHAGVLEWANCTAFDTRYYGTAFGILTLASFVSFFDVVGLGWIRVELLVGLALICNTMALVVFAPPLTLTVYAVFFLVLVILTLALRRDLLQGSGAFRCLLLMIMTVGAPVLYVLAYAEVPFIAAKMAAFAQLNPFPDDFFAVRKVLSALSLDVWKANPWIGTGLDTFALDVRFAASAENWGVISSLQQTALNGWWQLLVERGVIGAAVIAIALGMLLWTYGSRFWHSRHDMLVMPDHVLGPLVLMATVGLTFFNCSFLRPEIMLLMGTVLSFSSGCFPARSGHKKHEEHAHADHEGKKS